MTTRILLTIALMTSAMTASTIASEKRAGGARLRPQDARLASVLKAGALRSETFRALVDRIEASNVIVYIAINPVLKPSLAGALTWMAQAGEFRYVRASISTELTFDQMIATVAHELQHAVELVEDESVTDEASLVALYRRIGEPSRSSPSGWETQTAQQTGYKVRRELVAVPSDTMAKASLGRS
jgi:hypothetical protein